jgi:hypothetical protein
MTISRSVVASLQYLVTNPSVCMQSSMHVLRLGWFATGIAMILASCGALTGCCGVRMAGGCGGCGISMMQSDPGRGVSCDSGACGTSSCSGCTTLFNGQIAARMRSGLFGGCSSGCGEVYYDEQINEPPTCDPCGANGEFVGGGCGPCRPLLHRIRDMMGTPFVLGCNSCGGSSGCDSCSTGGCSSQYSENSGGYCSQCNDGVAGNPNSLRHHPTHMHSNAMPSPATRPTPDLHSEGSMLMDPASSNLQPVPDAAADALPPPGLTPIPSASRGSRSPMKIGNATRQVSAQTALPNKVIPASSRRVQPKLVTR